MGRKRKRMDKFRLDEVSFVDRPAQQGAKAVISKGESGGTAAVLRYRTEDGLCTEYLTLHDLLKELHDAAPNAEKSAVAALIAKQELAGTGPSGEENPEDMAREMLDRATAQFDRMVEGFMDLTDTDAAAAEESIVGSRVGRRLAALIGAAERMLSDDMDAEDIEARRRAEVARMRASVGTDTAKNRNDEMTTAERALDARESTDDELDRMAKAHAASHGEDFFTAYEAVCDTPEGIALIRKRDAFHAFAIGGVDHGRSVDTLAKTFDEDAAGRRTDLYKAQEGRLTSREADDALLKRAKAIQVGGSGVSLLAALDMAKAENPGLANVASI